MVFLILICAYSQNVANPSMKLIRFYFFLVKLLTLLLDIQFNAKKINYLLFNVIFRCIDPSAIIIFWERTELFIVSHLIIQSNG